MGLVTCDCTAAVASGDTVETVIGTVTLPANAKAIVGVGVSMNAAGITTLEGSSGIFRVSINSIDVSPAKFPIEGNIALTAFSGNSNLKVWPVNWGPGSNAQVTFYVTMDMTNTVNPTFRGFVLYEK